MIKFNLRQLFKNKTLWAFPGLFLLFTIIMFIWGDITAAGNSYSFGIMMGGAQIPFSMVIPQLTGLVTLFCIIGLPNHFAKNLTSERGSLLLSKPVSRVQYFFSDFASVLTVLFSYTLFSVALIAILAAVKAVIFPVQFLLGMLLFLPLIILTYYITIVLFLMLTESYLAGALLGWFVTGLSSALLNSDKLLSMLGINSKITKTTLDVLSYLIPSSEGFSKIIGQIYSGGFATIDGSLLVFALVTCLPLGALSFYLYLNKEF